MEKLKSTASIPAGIQETISELQAKVKELTIKVNELTNTTAEDRKWLVVIAIGEEITQIEGPFPNVYPPIKIDRIQSFFLIQANEPTSLNIKTYVRNELKITEAYQVVNVQDRTDANVEELPEQAEEQG